MGSEMCIRDSSGLLPSFEAQLRDLSSVLEAAEIRFVRCIKPNNRQQPGVWDDDVVRAQLRSSAVIAAIETIAAGFPDRVPHAQLVRRYAYIAPRGALTEAQRAAPDARGAAALLAAMGIDAKLFAAGTSKTFLRAGVTQTLERLREAKLISAAAKIGARQRGRVARFAFSQMLAEDRARKARAEAEAAERMHAAQAAVDAAERAARRDSGAGVGGAGGANGGRVDMPHLSIDLSSVVARAHEQLDSAREQHAAAAARNAAAGESEALRRAKALLEPSSEQSARAHRIARWQARQAAAAALGQTGAGSGAHVYRRRPPTAPAAPADADASQRASAEQSARITMSRSIPYESASVALSLASALGHTVAELEYGRYIGLHLDTVDAPDRKLLYLAREGLDAALPDGWEQRMDPEGRTYYANTSTAALSRAHPADALYRQRVIEARYGVDSYLALVLSHVCSAHVVDALADLRPSQLKRAAAAFERYDTSRAGVISFQHFAFAINAHAIKLDRPEPPLPKVRAMFTTANLSNTGTIDLNEFVHMQRLRKDRSNARKRVGAMDALHAGGALASPGALARAVGAPSADEPSSRDGASSEASPEPRAKGGRAGGVFPTLFQRGQSVGAWSNATSSLPAGSFLSHTDSAATTHMTTSETDSARPHSMGIRASEDLSLIHI